MYPFHITEHKHTASLLPSSTLPSAHLCGAENGWTNILSPLFESSPPLPGKQRRDKRGYFVYTHASPQCPSAIVLTVAPRSRLQGKQVLRLCRCVFSRAVRPLYNSRRTVPFPNAKAGRVPASRMLSKPLKRAREGVALRTFIVSDGVCIGCGAVFAPWNPISLSKNCSVAIFVCITQRREQKSERAVGCAKPADSTILLPWRNRHGSSCKFEARRPAEEKLHRPPACQKYAFDKLGTRSRVPSKYTGVF